MLVHVADGLFSGGFKLGGGIIHSKSRACLNYHIHIVFAIAHGNSIFVGHSKQVGKLQKRVALSCVFGEYLQVLGPG